MMCLNDFDWNTWEREELLPHNVVVNIQPLQIFIDGFENIETSKGQVLSHDGKTFSECSTLVFKRIDGNTVVVINQIELTIVELLKYRDILQIETRKSGHLFIHFTDYDNESLERRQLRDKFSEERSAKREREWKKKVKYLIEQQKWRNNNRFPYDLSGDDLSLNPDMW